MGSKQSMKGFTVELASKAPTPGGGGASAFVGSVGTALGQMVGNLTVGKKKYADVESEVEAVISELDGLRIALLGLIEADAEAFAPLARAYSIPKDDPTRADVMEAALKDACAVPLEIMRTLARVVELMARLGEIGSALAISDVGVGAVCCKAALQGASLNVFINTKMMADRSHAASLETETDRLLDTYCTLAEDTYQRVVAQLR